MTRCWGNRSPDYVLEYHDNVWGKPVHDDRTLFKMLCMESFQAGLSWTLILKREGYLERAFDGFDPNKIADYEDDMADMLLTAEGMIKNRKKIEAVIHNSRQFLRVQEEFGSFDKYIWGFTEGKTIDNRPISYADIPAKTELSDIIAKDLKKRGFKFLGSVTVYAFLQSMGIVNDHLIDCDYR